MKRLKRGKKAQFYLIAAIIIIIIIFGIFTVSNYAKTEKKDSVVYDLQKEFGLESGKIEDFTLYNKYESSDYLDNWTKMYVNNKGQELDNFVVVYGNESQITLLNFTKSSSGNSCISDSCNWDMSTFKFERENTAGAEGNVKVVHVIIGGVSYEFKLQPGKNFAFLIKSGGFVA